MSTKVHSSRNWRITSNNGDLKRKCLLFKLGQFTSNYPAPAFAVYFNGALILFNNIHIQRTSATAQRPVFSSMEPALPVLPLWGFHPLPTPVFLLLLLLRIQNLPVFLLMNKMTYVQRVQSAYQRPKMTFFPQLNIPSLFHPGNLQSFYVWINEFWDFTSQNENHPVTWGNLLPGVDFFKSLGS